MRPNRTGMIKVALNKRYDMKFLSVMGKVTNLDASAFRNEVLLA